MISKEEIGKFENELNSFNGRIRENALSELLLLLETGEIIAEHPCEEHNMHCHTFYSYNGYGYSPSYIAWWTKKHGLFASGIVDFDVLDGVDEFIKSSSKLDIRGTCGIETRVFISELIDKEINSPGEPGISYHMGVGFQSGQVAMEVKDFFLNLKKTASGRTREIVKKVNAFLVPVELDFEKDVIPLTPAGNVTERHVCAAYAAKAEEKFKDNAVRAKFWSEKLGISVEEAGKVILDTVKLQGIIRSKTMKSGGVGYVKPKPESFPPLKQMNEFILKCGGIPAITWLSGESAGEADPGKLIELHIKYGAAAINIIPDRNWNFPDPEVKKKKVAKLHQIIEASKKRGLPVIVGTEMNAPGLKLIDDFSSDALIPYFKDFTDGAAIVFAHSLLQKKGMGYLGSWASESFRDVFEKNKFFIAAGRQITPEAWKKLEKLSPDEIKKAFSS